MKKKKILLELTPKVRKNWIHVANLADTHNSLTLILIHHPNILLAR